MILYLDTSALVKLFVPEVHSERIRAAISRSDLVVTQVLAYVEAYSAFARLAESRENRSLFQRLRRELDARWTEWEIVEVDERLVRRAGKCCARYPLRGCDSVHLAAAEMVHAASGSSADFRFGVFDSRLARAGAALGLAMLEA